MKKRDWKGTLSRLAWLLAEASVMADPLAYGAYLQALNAQESDAPTSPAEAAVDRRVTERPRLGFGYHPAVVGVVARSRS
jgi:hypothetical protein